MLGKGSLGCKEEQLNGKLFVDQKNIFKCHTPPKMLIFKRVLTKCFVKKEKSYKQINNWIKLGQTLYFGEV